MDPLFEQSWTGNVATTETVDRALKVLFAQKKTWADLKITEKIGLMKQIRDRLYSFAVSMSKETAATKYRDDISVDFVTNVFTIVPQINAMIYSLGYYYRYGKFPQPATRTTPSGQTVVKSFPASIYERYTDFYAMNGVSVELYLKPGKEVTQGHAYVTPNAGRVCALLGAGNQPYVSFLDALHMLFAENCVVIMKHHPIQLRYAKWVDVVMEPLKKRGFFFGINADIPVTRHMLYHPNIGCVHMTGGIETHDAIVWGPKDEQAKRKAEKDPLLKVPITSELGGVTPWLIVPGPWTEKDLAHHAGGLAEAVANNNSCNCLAAKMIMLPAEWELSDKFIELFKQEIAVFPLQPAYYPGVTERHQAFLKANPNAITYPSKPNKGAEACPVKPLPWAVLVLEKYPEDPKEEYTFNNEPFAPCVTFVKVPTGQPAGSGTMQMAKAFMARAVPAANKDVWGNLSCSIFVHPEVEKEIPTEVQKALDGLEFGCVCVNAWSSVGFMQTSAHWGGFQGDQTLEDVGSGLGSVRNCYMFDHPQKSVVRTPFISGVPLVHPQPLYKSPPPLAVMQIITGLTTGGLLGVWKCLSSK